MMEVAMSDRRYGWELMHALSERILRSNSATEELERWCGERAIGDGRVVALCARHAVPELCDDESLEALYPHDVRGQTKFRSVRLATAGIVVAEALNWYFPDRLTLEMREALETTNIPFGRAVKPLRPRRRTFLVRRCTPEQMAKGPIDPGATAFEHRAVVYGEGDAPLAVVHERFRNILVCGVSEFMAARQPTFSSYQAAE
jgi:chorismate-pyruvate lyase